MRRAPEFDVFVVGDYCLDLIFTGMPGFLELGSEVVASRFAMTPGGAYIAAAAMHRLGLRVAWAADFGSDDFSQFVERCARQEGLEDRFFVRHERPLRYVTVAASYPEDRAFLAYYDPAPTVPAGVRALPRVRARALYVPGFYSGPLLDLGLPLVRARGMKLVMDGNSPEDTTLETRGARRAARSVDVLLVNAREARRMTGESDLQRAMRVLSALPPLLVVKDGGNGAYAWAEGQLLHEPAIPVEPLDTTGAGDCFSAGFLRAWLAGRPLRDCLRWGNIVGGLSTLALGGTGQVTTLADVERWLARYEAAGPSQSP